MNCFVSGFLACLVGLQSTSKFCVAWRTAIAFLAVALLRDNFGQLSYILVYSAYYSSYYCI